MSRRKRKGRAIDGMLLLDKPQGITSNGALQEVKHLFGAAKAGHTGSLDPLATGTLPLCFGEATKFSQFLLDANKRYLATFKLGIVTDSGDAEGEVIRTADASAITVEDVKGLLADFTGEIEQIPSMFSALKHKGEPLYKLARQGIEVERKPRKVTIFNLDLIDFQADEFVLDITCSKGTYVRSLAEDIGEQLGCGAHICALRRTSAGPYSVADTYSIERLIEIKESEGITGLDKCLLPVSSAVEDWPAVMLTDNSAYYIRQGQPVQVSRAPTEGWVRLFAKGEDGVDYFMGVGEIDDDGKIAPRRLLATQ